MFKVLKSFILANGKKYEVDQTIEATELTESEIDSLKADGSLEAMEANPIPEPENESNQETDPVSDPVNENENAPEGEAA